ncbi:MAG: four helix bundle protein [Phycisphaerales bacterium]|nr:four helix bundle protein [Phycisphaerales bacterium]
MDLCTSVYEISRAFPNDERFGLTSQIRRAVVSVPSNIAEKYGRQRTHDYLRFLDVALGSLCEVETQLLLCRNLRIASEDGIAGCMSLLRDVDRLLCGLSRAVRNSAHKVEH